MKEEVRVSKPITVFVHTLQLLVPYRVSAVLTCIYVCAATERGGGVGRAALQRERAAPVRGALLQTVHVLRPLRVAALRTHQAGPAV